MEKLISDVTEAVARLNHVLMAQTGDEKPLVSISVSREVFDRMVLEHHQSPISNYGPDGNKVYRSYFKPSDAYFFTIYGIEFRPALKEKL